MVENFLKIKRNLCTPFDANKNVGKSVSLNKPLLKNTPIRPENSIITEILKSIGVNITQVEQFRTKVSTKEIYRKVPKYLIHFLTTFEYYLTCTFSNIYNIECLSFLKR